MKKAYNNYKPILWLILFIIGILSYQSHGAAAQDIEKQCNSTKEFQCNKNNKTICLSVKKLQDGVQDCSDGFDEACNSNEFHCGSQLKPTCILTSLVNNGKIDCANGRDEDNLRTCTEKEFQCVDGGKCISKKRFQDGINDCQDGSDEECLPSQHECLCGFPRCLDKIFVKDGKSDCLEGSDEGPVDKTHFVCPDWDPQELIAIERKKRASDIQDQSDHDQHNGQVLRQQNRVRRQGDGTPRFRMGQPSFPRASARSFPQDAPTSTTTTTTTEKNEPEKSFTIDSVVDTRSKIRKVQTVPLPDRELTTSNPTPDSVVNGNDKPTNSVTKKTLTLIGFVHFTTTVSDTEIVFMPRTMMEERMSSTKTMQDASSAGATSTGEINDENTVLNLSTVFNEVPINGLSTSSKPESMSEQSRDITLSKDSVTSVQIIASSPVAGMHFERTETSTTHLETSSQLDDPLHSSLKSEDDLHPTKSSTESLKKTVPLFRETVRLTTLDKPSSESKSSEHLFSETHDLTSSKLLTEATSFLSSSLLEVIPLETASLVFSSVSADDLLAHTSTTATTTESMTDKDSTTANGLVIDVPSTTSNGDDFGIIDDPRDDIPSGVTEALSPIPPNSTDIIFNRKGSTDGQGLLNKGMDETIHKYDEEDKPTENGVSLNGDDVTPSVTDDYDDYPTGLVTSTEGFVVNEGTTTHYTTVIYGTFIDDNYAQIVQSTSRLVFEVSSTTEPSMQTDVVENGTSEGSFEDKHRHNKSLEESEQNAGEDIHSANVQVDVISPTATLTELESVTFMNEPLSSSNQIVHENDIVSTYDIKSTPTLTEPTGSENLTTVFATHTYFTTYFLNGSTSVESRQEVISSIFPKGYSVNVSDTHQTHTSSNYSGYEDTNDDIINEKPLEFHNEISSSTKDGFLQTIFSTVTYFTTFFLGGTTSTASQTEVITRTLPHSQSSSIPAESTNDTVPFIQDTESDPSNKIHQISTTEKDHLQSTTITGEMMTFYTTYTFFTTFSSDGDTFVESREVVSTNIGPAESLVSIAFTSIYNESAKEMSDDQSTPRSSQIISDLMSSSQQLISSSQAIVSSAQADMYDLASSPHILYSSQLFDDTLQVENTIDYLSTDPVQLSSPIYQNDVFENSSTIGNLLDDIEDTEMSTASTYEIDGSDLVSSQFIEPIFAMSITDEPNLSSSLVLDEPQSIASITDQPDPFRETPEEIYGIVDALADGDSKDLQTTELGVIDEEVTSSNPLDEDVNKDHDGIESSASAAEAKEVDVPALELQTSMPSTTTEKLAADDEENNGKVEGDEELTSDLGEFTAEGRNLSPAAVLKTFYTTYTYFTTYFSNGQKAVSTNKETVSNIVTEPLAITQTQQTTTTQPSKLQSSPSTPVSETTRSDKTQGGLPKTYYTTYTYFTTTILDGVSTVLSSMSTLSNVVSDETQNTGHLQTTKKAQTTSSSPSLKITTTNPVTYYTTYTYYTTFFSDGTPVISTSMETISNIQFGEVLPSIETSPSRTTHEPITATATPETEDQVFKTVTYYTTYTYYTTSYDGDETIISSNYETISNVETKMVPALESTRTTETKTKPIRTTSESIRPTTSSSYPTGLISTSVDESVNDGTTTIYSTEVFGTYINGVYAHVVQSTSKILTEETSTVDDDATPTEEYREGLVSSTTGSTVIDDITTMFTTKVLGTYIDGTYAQIVESTSHILNGDSAISARTRGNTPSETNYKTGLISTEVSSKVSDGTTTVIQSDIIGTYVNGTYAQIIQSTSSILDEASVITEPSTESAIISETGEKVEDSITTSVTQPSTTDSVEENKTTTGDDNKNEASAETQNATSATEASTTETTNFKRRPLISTGNRPNLRPFRPRRPNNRLNKNRPNGLLDEEEPSAPANQTRSGLRQFGRQKAGSATSVSASKLTSAASSGVTQMMSSSPGSASAKTSGILSSMPGSRVASARPGSPGIRSTLQTVASELPSTTKFRFSPTGGVFRPTSRKTSGHTTKSALSGDDTTHDDEHNSQSTNDDKGLTDEIATMSGVTDDLTGLTELIHPTPTLTTSDKQQDEAKTEKSQSTTGSEPITSPESSTEAKRKPGSRFKVPLRSNRPNFFRVRRPGANTETDGKDDSVAPSVSDEEKFEESLPHVHKRLPPRTKGPRTTPLRKEESSSTESNTFHENTDGDPEKSDLSTSEKPTASSRLLRLRGNRRNRLLSRGRPQQQSDAEEHPSDGTASGRRRRRSTSINAESYNEGETAYQSREYDYYSQQSNDQEISKQTITKDINNGNQQRSTPPRQRNRNRSNTQQQTNPAKSTAKQESKDNEQKTASKTRPTQRPGRNPQQTKTQQITATKTAGRGRQQAQKTETPARTRQRGNAGRTATATSKQDTPSAITSTATQRGRGRTVTATRRVPERVRTTIRATETPPARIRPTKVVARRGRVTRPPGKQRAQEQVLRVTRTTTTTEATTEATAAVIQTTEKQENASDTTEIKQIVQTPVTITHILNTTKILPIYRGLRTEIRTISTTFPSEEVIQPSQYTIVNDNGNPKTLLHSFVTINSETPALTNVQEVVITSKVEEFLTTTRGRVDELTRTMTFLSTVSRTMSQAHDALRPSMPFGSYILSQLLFNQFFPNQQQQQQVTYSTSTYSYVTTVTVESTAVFPIKFRDKTKLTTITESKVTASTVTTVTSIPVTVTPNLNLLPALLNPVQYPQANVQQFAMLPSPEVDESFSESESVVATPPAPNPLPPESLQPEEAKEVPIPNLALPPPPPPAPVTSVITLYLSGVKPGQYNTFLTTVTLNGMEATNTVDMKKISRETRDVKRAEEEEESPIRSRKQHNRGNSKFFNPTATDVVTYTLLSTVLLDGSLSTITSKMAVTQVATNNHWYEELTKTSSPQNTAILYAGGVPVDVLITPDEAQGDNQGFPFAMANFDGDFPPITHNNAKTEEPDESLPVTDESQQSNFTMTTSEQEDLSFPDDNTAYNLDGEESELSETSQVFFQRIPDHQQPAQYENFPTMQTSQPTRLKLKRRRRPPPPAPESLPILSLQTDATDMITEQMMEDTSAPSPPPLPKRRKAHKRRRKLKTTPIPVTEFNDDQLPFTLNQNNAAPPPLHQEQVDQQGMHKIPVTHYTTFTYYTTVYDGTSTSFKTQEAVASRITMESMSDDDIDVLQRQYNQANQNGNSFVNLGTRTKGYKTTVVILGSSLSMDASDLSPTGRYVAPTSTSSAAPILNTQLPETFSTDETHLSSSIVDQPDQQEEKHTIHTVYTYLYTFINGDNTRYSNREITTTSLVTGSEIPGLVKASGLQELDGKYVLGNSTKQVNIGSRVHDGTTTEVNMAMKTFLELNSRTPEAILPSTTHMPLDATIFNSQTTDDAATVQQQPANDFVTYEEDITSSSPFSSQSQEQLIQDTTSLPPDTTVTEFGMRKHKKPPTESGDSSTVYTEDQTDPNFQNPSENPVTLMDQPDDVASTIESSKSLSEDITTSSAQRGTPTLQVRRVRPTPASAGLGTQSTLHAKVRNRLNGRVRGTSGYNNYASRFSGQNARREKQRTIITTPTNVIMVTYTTTTLVPFLGDTSFRTLHIRTSSQRTLAESEMYLLTAPHLVAVTTPISPTASEAIILKSSNLLNDTTEYEDSVTSVPHTEMTPSNTTTGGFNFSQTIEDELQTLSDNNTEVEKPSETLSEGQTKPLTDSTIQPTTIDQSQLNTLEKELEGENDIETSAEPTTTESIDKELSLEDPEVVVKEVFGEDDTDDETKSSNLDEATTFENEELPSQSSGTNFEEELVSTEPTSEESPDDANNVLLSDTKTSKELHMLEDESTDKAIDDLKSNDVAKNQSNHSSSTSEQSQTTHELSPNITKTYFTTYTYFNIYPAGSTSITVNSTSTTSDVVIVPSSDYTANYENRYTFDTTSVYTTSTYFNTGFDGDSEITETSKETITQVIITEAQMRGSEAIQPTSVMKEVKESLHEPDQDNLSEKANLDDATLLMTKSPENLDMVQDYLLKTYYTTFTYFTTYLMDDETSIASSTEVSSNVVTEKVTAKMTETLPPLKSSTSQAIELVTRTYYTTFTYFTTYVEGSETTVTSNLDVTSNVVTETATKQNIEPSKLEIKPTPTSALKTTKSAIPDSVSSRPKIKETQTPTTAIVPQHQLKTYYTTFTYFTTYYEGSETVVTSSEETITNVVTKTESLTPTRTKTENVILSTPILHKSGDFSKHPNSASYKASSAFSYKSTGYGSQSSQTKSSGSTIIFFPEKTTSTLMSTTLNKPTSSSSISGSTIIFFSNALKSNESSEAGTNSSSIMAEESVHEDSLSVINSFEKNEGTTTKKPSNTSSTPFKIGPVISGLAGLLINGGLALSGGGGGGAGTAAVGGGSGVINQGIAPPIAPIISSRNDTDKQHIVENNQQGIRQERPPAVATISGMKEPNFIPVGGLGASLQQNIESKIQPSSVLRTGGFTRIEGPLLPMPHPGIVIDVVHESLAKHRDEKVPPALQSSMQPGFNSFSPVSYTEHGFTPINADNKKLVETTTDKPKDDTEIKATSTTSQGGVKTVTSIFQGQSTIFFNRRRPNIKNIATIPTLALLGSESDEDGITRIPSVTTIVDGTSTTSSTVWIQHFRPVTDIIQEGNPNVIIEATTTTYYTTHTFYTTTFINGNPTINSREVTSSEVVILRPMSIATTSVDGESHQQTLKILAVNPSEGGHSGNVHDESLRREDADVKTTGLRHKFITGDESGKESNAHFVDELKVKASTSFPSDPNVIKSTFTTLTDGAISSQMEEVTTAIVQQDEQTHYTLAHYYTESADGATPVMLDREETSSEIVTLSATTITQFLPRPILRTYFTTYYYYTTSLVGDSSVVHSRAETSTQVVTLGPFSEGIVATNTEHTITFTATAAQDATTHTAVEANDSPRAQGTYHTQPPLPGYATYYTRYTYFTTFLQNGISSVTSNIITYTQVVPQITRTILFTGDGDTGGQVQQTAVLYDRPGMITRLPEGQVTAYRVVDGTRTVLYVDNGATRTLLSTRIEGTKTTAIFGGGHGQQATRFTHIIDGAAAAIHPQPTMQTITITETVEGGTKTLIRYITPTVTTISTVTTTVQNFGGSNAGEGGETVISGTRHTVFIDGGKGTVTFGDGQVTPPLKTEYFTKVEATGRTVIGTRTTVTFSDGFPKTEMFPFTTTVLPRTTLITVIGGHRTLTRIIVPTATAQGTQITEIVATDAETGFTSTSYIEGGHQAGGIQIIYPESGKSTTEKQHFGVVTIDHSEIDDNKKTEATTYKAETPTTPQGGVTGGLQFGEMEILTKCKLHCDSNKKEACRFKQGKWQCACRPAEGRVDNSRLCEPVLSYELMLNLIRMGNQDLVFSDKYRNYHTKEYQDLSSKCALGLQRAYSTSRLSQTYRGSEVISFTDARLVNPEWKGIVARVVVNVREGDSGIVKSELQSSLAKTNYSLGGTDLIVNPTSSGLYLQDLDECSSRDINDCSSNATCTNTPGSFTCKCNEGLDDLDAKFPGRVCEETSVVCDFCSYQGECITDENGYPACKCYPWRLGSQCQINGLALAIILPILLGLLLLALLIWCCCCRKGGCCGMGPCCQNAACCGPGGCCSCCGKRYRKNTTNIVAASNGTGGVFPRIGGSITEGEGTLDKKAMITEDSASNSSGEQSRFAHIADAFGAHGTGTQKSKKTGKMSAHGYEDRSLSGFADVPTVVIPRAKHQHPKQYVSASTENILQRGESSSEMLSAENKLINLLESESQLGTRSAEMNKSRSNFVTVPSTRSKSQAMQSSDHRSATMESTERRHKRSANAASAATAAVHRHGTSGDKHATSSNLQYASATSAAASGGYDVTSRAAGRQTDAHSGGKYSKSKHLSSSDTQLMSHSSATREQSRSSTSQGYQAGTAGHSSHVKKGSGNVLGIGSLRHRGEGTNSSAQYHKESQEYQAKHTMVESDDDESDAQYLERNATGQYRNDVVSGNGYHSSKAESKSYSKKIELSDTRDGMLRDYDEDSTRYGANSYGNYGTRTVSEVCSCDETTVEPATRTLASESYYSSSKGRSSRYTRTGDDTDPTDPDENITDVSVSTMMVPNAHIYYKEDSCDYSESSEQSMTPPTLHNHQLRAGYYDSDPANERYERKTYYNYERKEHTSKHSNLHS